MATDALTYDPVVDGQPLPRVRLLSPLRPPPPGRALVLVPDAGPALTIRPGEHVPDARYGVYQGMFMVDTTEHRLVFTLRLASRDPSTSFHCRVELMSQVTDPADVVARGIRDMAAAWYGPVRERLRGVARGYGVARHHEAEEALNAELREVRGDSTVRLRGVQVELLAEGGSEPLRGAAAPRRSRVRGAASKAAAAPEPTPTVPPIPSTPPPSPPESPPETPPPPEPHVVVGEVVARKEEPLPRERRVSRVRGTGAKRPKPGGGTGGEGAAAS
ncbi:hypothetical protein [Streptomyces sp. 6N223]|uniref:hypothetical protein n=1 Tax=Streptomyces sp. 6N223 TaxID=3457412 RepID=UPI003FCEF96F